MADLQGIGNMLQGIGAGFSGNGPQYMYAQQQQQEADALKDERRRKALLTDFATGFSLLNNGQTEQATKLFQNRLEMLKQLKAPDMSDTQGIVDRLVSGDPAKIDEVKAGIGSIIQAAMLTGELNSPESQQGMASAKTRQFVDGTVQMVLPTGQVQVILPNGQPVSGEDARAALQQAMANEVSYAGQKSGAMAGAQQGAAYQYAAPIAGAQAQARASVEAATAPQIAAATTAATSTAEREAAQQARLIKAKQVYTPFGAQLTALRDAFKGTGTGPLVGRFSGYTSSSQKALAARDIMSPMLKQVVRDAGEGTFAKNDQDQIDAMMPKETDLPEVVDYKIGLLDTFVRGKLGVPNETPSPIIDWNDL